MSGAHPQADRAGGLRPEPASQSQPKALIPCAIADALDAAADLLAQDGRWIQGMFSQAEAGKPTCYCAMGAIITVAPTAMGVRTIEYLEARLPPSNRSADLRAIAKWNDAPEHTQDEVVATLRAQAIEARRAATGTGAVHESAVPQGMRPEDSQ